MFKITNYDHIGIRVTDLDIAKNFYASLGFLPEAGEASAEHTALGLINEAGLRITLIYNGIKTEGNKNILIDVEKNAKHPGITHAAFVVDDLDQLIQKLEQINVALSEGPTKLSERRLTCFIRDPDGNVLEFNQLTH